MAARRVLRGPRASRRCRFVEKSETLERKLATTTAATAALFDVQRRRRRQNDRSLALQQHSDETGHATLRPVLDEETHRRALQEPRGAAFGNYRFRDTIHTHACIDEILSDCSSLAAGAKVLYNLNLCAHPRVYSTKGVRVADAVDEASISTSIPRRLVPGLGFAHTRTSSHRAARRV